MCSDIYIIPLNLYSGVREDFVGREMAAVPEPELLQN
jgi:hypothetical protein